MKAETKSTTREHIRDLFLLFAVPIAVAIIVAIVLIVPHLFAHPKYDFIYCSGYDCQSNYSVSSSGILTPVKESQYSPLDPSSLYFYNIATDAAQPLTLKQAARYHLSQTSKSPDGYTFQSDSSDSGFLFWGGNSGTITYKLRNGAAIKSVNLLGDNSNINFIGWVQRGK
ncbi:MAG TPA: hypothetical protein VFQ70_01100 [Candidatus Saccharimonadaceae bacterium]|nr:hypothetical protein [Candidatus Saccharimonadaceae bacterium]